MNEKWERSRQDSAQRISMAPHFLTDTRAVCRTATLPSMGQLCKFGIHLTKRAHRRATLPPRRESVTQAQIYKAKLIRLQEQWSDRMEMKLEVVVAPISGVDRAKRG